MANAEQGLLISTDCVEISGGLLRETAQILQEHNAVIHCTADRGYALLGLRRYNPFLFSDMPWSTDTVSDITIAGIGQLGLSLRVGQILHDVDEPQDLHYLTDQWK